MNHGSSPSGAVMNAADFLKECAANQAAFALWREAGDRGISALRCTVPDCLDSALPENLDADGFLLSPFAIKGDSPGATHPAVWLASDGAIITLNPPSGSDPGKGEPVVALGSLAAHSAGPPPRLLDETAYRKLVARGVAAIRAGGVGKVVASRAERRSLGGNYDVLALFSRLCAAHQHALVALVGVPDVGLWLVATPETLLKINGAQVRTMALAGTQPLAADADPADALWSAKFIEEQALVSRYIRAIFQEAGFTDIEEYGPETVRAANLAHLCSRFEALAPEGNVAGMTRNLLQRMHPTSAVCGMPREAAFDFLAREENYDRSYYSGFLGPVSAAAGQAPSRAAFYVNLRSARLIGDDIYLYVGAGVTAHSDPSAEWEETVQKTKTLGDHL